MKRTTHILIVVLFCMLLPQAAFGQNSTNSQTTSKITISFIFQDQTTKLNNAPVITNGRVMLPVKEMAALMTAGRDSLVFEWNAKSKSFMINYFGKVVKATVGNKTVYTTLDSSDKEAYKKLTLDLAPQLINGITYAPIQLFKDGLGAEVYYDAKTKILRFYIM